MESNYADKLRELIVPFDDPKYPTDYIFRQQGRNAAAVRLEYII